MTQPHGPPGDPRRRPATVRVAMWSARHRWPVATLWVVLTIGLFVASTIAGGTRAERAVRDPDEAARFESGRAYEVFEGTGEERAQRLLLIVSRDGATVDDPAYAADIRAIVGRLAALESTVDGAVVPTFGQVVDPIGAPPAAGLVSPDGTTVRIVATVPSADGGLEERLAPVRSLVDELRGEHPDTRIHALNNTLANEEISEVVNRDMDRSLVVTVPLTFLILLVAFGALVAAVVPLVLAMTALVAAFGLLALYSQFVTPVSPFAGQLIVLIGVAVAVDYSLFLITRFRSERRRGRPLMRAIEIASSTAGRAVFFSGLAVMISIAGLFVIEDELFRSMAVGTIAVVLISVVGSLTFLPAALAILGDRVNTGEPARWLRAAGLGAPARLLDRNRPEGHGLWSALVRRVMRRPLTFAAVSGAALLLMASPVSRLDLGTTDLSSFPDSIDAVRALALVNEKWPEGATLQLQVAVTAADEPATEAAIARFGDAVLDVPGVHPPLTVERSRDGSVAMISVVLAGTQNDGGNWSIVRQVRGELVPAHFGDLPEVEAYVTGDAAAALDVSDFYRAGIPAVFAFVLGLSFVLLLVAFHSIVIPIKSILLNLLSTGAAYGVLVLVFQEGWFADALGVKPGVIESFVPIFVFTILFGLSMDYHVFILTRVKEARDRGVESNEAVAHGIAVTSGTITSAAAIMVAVFLVFVTLQLVIIKQVGLGLAVAVLLDATIVRSVLLPATMRLLGEWNWWMPRALRWIPRITIEGEPEDVAEASDDESASAPAPAGA